MPRVDPALSLTLATAVASLFLASIVHKIRDPWRFRAAVSGFRVLPNALVTAVSALVLGAECAVVAGFPFGAARAYAMLLAAALLLLYAAAIAVNLLRGRTRIDCGCGFGERDRISGRLVGRNVLLACAALLACLPRTARELTGMDGFVIVCAALAAALLYMAQELLAEARTRGSGEA